MHSKHKKKKDEVYQEWKELLSLRCILCISDLYLTGYELVERECFELCQAAIPISKVRKLQQEEVH